MAGPARRRRSRVGRRRKSRVGRQRRSRARGQDPEQEIPPELREDLIHREPAEGRQGFIGRVTDTVKGIVPGWLQKYFKKSEETNDTVQRTTETKEHTVETDDDVDHIVVDDDEGFPTTDETSEQMISSSEEPSTRQSIVNIPEILTRPSLHRASLNFSILDSPAFSFLNCQPSTFSAFSIGTPGFSLVKEIKDSTSQHDDDNISTTSGFSSWASDKDVAVSKNTNVPQPWSPEVDRSAFGALSPSLGNTSVFKSSQLGDSPFYPGKTAYGGAAAAPPSRMRATPYQPPLRRQVKAKPANVESYGVTSSAAHRILEALEKISSPIAEAKKIPILSPPHLPLTTESFLSLAEIHPKKKKVDAGTPPVKKLIIPKTISISTNRSFYIKPSLVSSVAANASNRRAQNEKHNELKRNDVPDGPATSKSNSFSFPKFSTPASNGLSSGGGGKMMRERGSHYVTKPANEEPEIPALPEIPLPLSVSALPSFNFSTLSNTATSPVALTKSADMMTHVVNKSPMYTFSSPIVKSTDSNAQSPGSSVDFTFSVPAVKMSTPPRTMDNDSAVTTPEMHVEKMIVENNSNLKKKMDDPVGFCKPAKSLKEGSVMDILRDPGFSSLLNPTQSNIQKSTESSPMPSESSHLRRKVPFGVSNKQALGLWQCNNCFADNNASDGKCVSCSTLKGKPARASKPQIQSPPKQTCTKRTIAPTVMQDIGKQFKVAANTWECDTCMVLNKAEVTKCVACEIPKTLTVAKPALLLPPAAKPVTTPDKTATVSLLEAFKKPAGSWECTVCCVENKEQESKCVSCTSAKPGAAGPTKMVTSAPVPSSGQLSLLDQFKKPAGSWDCEVCFVQNKADAVKCASCESAKPGTKAELKGFGMPAVSTSSPKPAFKFGLPSSSSTGEIKIGASTDSASSANKFTSEFSLKFTGDFKFGVNSPASKPADNMDKASTFGTTTTASNPLSTGLQFGTTTPSQTEKDNLSKPLTSGFSFGTVSTTTSAPVAESSAATGFQFQPIKDKLANPTTSFNLNESEKKKSQSSAIEGFSFEKLEQKTDPVSTPFAFGKQDEKSDSTTTAQPPLFGMKNEGVEPKPFLFGKSEKTKDNSVPAKFAFGVPTNAEKDPDHSAKSVFGFGSQAATADTGTAKQTFSFLGSSSTAAQSVTPASSSNVFGSTVTANAASSSSNMFCTASQASNLASSSNVFGNTAPSNTPANSSSVFSGSAPSSNLANSTSVFGSTAPPSTAPPSSNVIFGIAAPASTSANSSNVFGNTAPTNTSANSSSIFGNSAVAANPSAATFLFGQPSSTTSGSVFGNPNESKSTFAFSGQESKPDTSSSNTSTAATPFIFGVKPASATPAAPSFNFGATNTSNVTGTGTSPFLFGTNSQSPAQSGLTVGANPVPAFGQCASQTPIPAFGSSSLFPAGSQPVPAFGSVSSSVQPPAFGQQATQPAFGSSAAPATGPGFQFGGNTNFNFASGGSQPVFTFGSNPGGPSTFGSNSAPAPAQPAQPGFMFNQTPAFNMGTNGRSATTSTISARKIKTARRRK